MREDGKMKYHLNPHEQGPQDDDDVSIEGILPPWVVTLPDLQRRRLCLLSCHALLTNQGPTTGTGTQHRSLFLRRAMLGPNMRN